MNIEQSQIDLVRHTYARATRIAPHLAATFYSELFAINPALRSLFEGDMVAQGKKLMDTLTFIVANLHDPEALLPAVRALAINHTFYGVEAHHYDAVGTALLRTLRHELGPTFTDEARAAWSAAYGVLSQAMRDAAYPDQAA